jgi:hypothetical protein
MERQSTEERMHELRAIYVNFLNLNMSGESAQIADNRFAPLAKNTVDRSLAS